MYVLYTLYKWFYLLRWSFLLDINHNYNGIIYNIDTGKIMKVVFSGSTTYDPVVAEEITVSFVILCSVVYYYNICAAHVSKYLRSLILIIMMLWRNCILWMLRYLMNNTSMLLPTQECIDYLCKGVQDYKDASKTYSYVAYVFLSNAVYFPITLTQAH